MFDLAQSITYRGLDLNAAAIASSGGPITGSKVESFTWPPVAGVGYTEKRTQGDGLDASDVFLGGRQFALRGTLYGATRAATFDAWRNLAAVLAPSLAFDDDPDNFGFLPLAFSMPTDDTDNFPSGTIDVFINVRPTGTPDFGTISRDASGGDTAFALPWSVVFQARDPRVYVATAVEIDISGSSGASGTFTNRGTYPTPLTIVLVSAASSPQAFTYIGQDSDIVIAIPDLADGQHTLTLGDNRQVIQSYLGNNTLVNGDLATSAEKIYPEVGVGGGAYSWTAPDHNLLAGSVLRYHEAFI